MCISDYRIGRLIRWQTTRFNTTGPVNTTFGRNPYRVYLAVSRDAALGTTAGTLLTFEDGTVINLSNVLSTYQLNIRDWGTIICQGFVVTAVATQHVGSIVEGLLPSATLDALPDQFN
jgi:hypothetical protein